MGKVNNDVFVIHLLFYVMYSIHLTFCTNFIIYKMGKKFIITELVFLYLHDLYMACKPSYTADLFMIYTEYMYLKYTICKMIPST